MVNSGLTTKLPSAWLVFKMVVENMKKKKLQSTRPLIIAGLANICCNLLLTDTEILLKIELSGTFSVRRTISDIFVKCTFFYILYVIEDQDNKCDYLYFRGG